MAKPKRSNSQLPLFETSPSMNPTTLPRTQKKSPSTETAFNDIYLRLTSGLKAYFDEHHFKRGVLGVSGGVDSSLTLKIAADTLGNENVTALILPELGVTTHENIEHAKILCDFLKVHYFYQPINPFLMDFSLLPWKPNSLAHMNSKARIRAVLLYNYANTDNALVIGTSNKSELLLGYATKYGDLACDIEVIGSLYKTEVVKLAESVGLPPEIVYKTPTAELSSNQTDEGELGASYADIDKVLMKLDLGLEGCLEHGLPANLVQLVFRRVKQNEHKTKLPYTLPV